MKTAKFTKILSIVLEPEMFNFIKEEGTKKNLSFAEVIRRIILEYSSFEVCSVCGMRNLSNSTLKFA